MVPSFFIKLVFVSYEPFSFAIFNQPKTFCKTISPGEKIETLMLINSLELYPKFSQLGYSFLGLNPPYHIL